MLTTRRLLFVSLVSLFAGSGVTGVSGEFPSESPLTPTVDPTSVIPTTEAPFIPTFVPTNNETTTFPTFPPTIGPTPSIPEPTFVPPTPMETAAPTLAPTTNGPTTSFPTVPIFPTTAVPTTKAPIPTTKAPTTTTPIPTTAAPTTASPTFTPTTQIPTTKVPTTIPTTKVPTTPIPTTKAPTIGPTTNIPTTKAPTIGPTTNTPTTAVPIPTTKSPTTKVPTTQSPTTATPTPTTASPTFTPTVPIFPTTAVPTFPPPTPSTPSTPSTPRPTVIPTSFPTNGTFPTPPPGVDVFNLTYNCTMTEDDWSLLKSLIGDVINTGHGPVLVRNSFHDAGTFDTSKPGIGGPHAGMRFPKVANWKDNRGLNLARGILDPIKSIFGDKISHADLWQFAGAVVISNSGGPVISFRPGRADFTSESQLPDDGVLPDGQIESTFPLRQKFMRMGFPPKAVVTLSGAHVLGACHLLNSGFSGRWTHNNLRFSHQYFINLMTNLIGPLPMGFDAGDNNAFRSQWNLTLQNQPVPSDPTNPSNNLMMLNSDFALFHLSDTEFIGFVAAYAANETLFFQDFKQFYQQMQELGMTGLLDNQPIIDVLIPGFVQNSTSQIPIVINNSTSTTTPPTLPPNNGNNTDPLLGTCQHSPCQQGGKLVSGCSPAVTTICSADSFCCQNSWDSQCVQEVATKAGLSCPPTPSPPTFPPFNVTSSTGGNSDFGSSGFVSSSSSSSAGSSASGSSGAGSSSSSSSSSSFPTNSPGTPDPLIGTCSHSPCVQGAPLNFGCSFAATKVCQVDFVCCVNTWNEICVNQVLSIAGMVCPASPNNNGTASSSTGFPSGSSSSIGTGSAFPGSTGGFTGSGSGSTASTVSAPTGPVFSSSTGVGPGNNTNNSTCAHNPCQTGAALAFGCSTTVNIICSVDSFCCNSFWDPACVNEVGSIANQLCPPTLPPTTATPTTAAPTTPSPINNNGTCAHNLCHIGVMLTPGCLPAVTEICQLDPFCCNTEWDRICVSEVASVANLTCPPPTPVPTPVPTTPVPTTPVPTTAPPTPSPLIGTCKHDLCTPGFNLTVGCSPAVNVICFNDPFCCNTFWDRVCVAEVLSLAGLTCPTPLLTNSTGSQGFTGSAVTQVRRTASRPVHTLNTATRDQPSDGQVTAQRAQQTASVDQTSERDRQARAARAERMLRAIRRNE